MLLGNGFLPMFASGSGLALTGATWALDGSGRAYNTPTLGAELLTDGGLENWASSANLSSWTESVAGASTVNRESSIVQSGSHACRLDVDASNSSVFVSQALSPVVGDFYSVRYWAKSNIDGKVIAFSFNGTDYNKTLTTTYVEVALTIRYVSGSSVLLKRSSPAASSSLYFDTVSVKRITLLATLATVTGTSATQTAAAKIHTITPGTQAGVVSLLDSASNPQNFLIGYHDGTNVKLDKCVAGVYTNLISTAVAFSSTALASIVPIGSNQFQLWYNGSQRGANQTVSDASIISNTLYGLFSTYSGNLFTEFSLGGVVIPFQFPGA